MTYRIVTRAEIGLPVNVTNSNGSPRPPLKGASWMTAHYTGNNISYGGKDVAASIRLIQSVFAKTKPFEYNYVIGLPEDDLVYEYAGTFQAAHSAGENSSAVGVLFLVGVNDAVTPTMINKWRWLREQLALQGVTVRVVDQKMHYQMPGAATACPGNSIKSLWQQFLLPYSPPVIPPFEDEEEIVIAYIAQPPAGSPEPWLVVINGSVRYATSHDTQQGLPFVQVTGDQYPFLKKSAGL
jgi:hypothetical protein